jgi:ribonuclease P protein component
MDETLSPQERIRKKKDFSTLYKKGYRHRGKYFNLIYLSNDLCFSRMAVIASKKIGNAVKRNKVKRWMRALFRKNKKLLKNPLDIIFIAKKEILETSWLTLQKDLSAVLESIYQKNRPE